MALFRRPPFVQPRLIWLPSLGQAPITVALDSVNVTFSGQDIGFIYAPLPDTSQTYSGGFETAYERHLLRKRREQAEREEARESAEKLPNATDRDIAALLHAQAAKDAEDAELTRLSELVSAHGEETAREALSDRTAKAFVRALEIQTDSALLALDREMLRQFEDEEMAVLLALALDD